MSIIVLNLWLHNIGGFIHNFDQIREYVDTFNPVGFQKISETETVTIKNELLYSKTRVIEYIL